VKIIDLLRRIVGSSTIAHHINTNKTTMDDKLRQVQAEIAATEEKLATAKDKEKEDLVLSLTNLLVKLYNEEARVEARLSAGNIYCNRGECDVV
jgi:predicted DNA-binding protein YlxM (UPF0122 family)